jgi:hypothetical protein
MFLLLLFVASSLILSFRYSLTLFVTCLLASCLALFRLSPLIYLDPVTTAVLFLSFELIILGILESHLILLEFIITSTLFG